MNKDDIEFIQLALRGTAAGARLHQALLGNADTDYPGALARRAERLADGLKEALEPPKVVRCGVAVILEQIRANGDKYVLMGQRKGSHGAGTWSFPGGWMEFGEDFSQAGTREVKEEANLTISGALRVVDVMGTCFPADGKHSVTVLLHAGSGWTGQLRGMEPDKLQGPWEWVKPPAWPEPLFAPLLQSGYLMGLR